MATYNSNIAREYQLIVEITEHSQEIANNRSRLNWVVKLKQGQYRHNALCTYNLSINGVSVWASASGGTTVNSAAYARHTTFALASGTTGWITHGSDGKKTVAISAAYRTNNQTSGVIWICPPLSISASYTITTIPRTSKPTLSSTSFDLGTEITINTNRASSSFTHTIRYTFGSASGTIATGVGASTKWTPPLTLASQIPNAVSGTGYVYCDTYSGSTKIGTESVRFTGKVPASVVPAFTTVTHSEYVGDVASKVGAYVQGQSRLSLAITGAAGGYGTTATLKYEITFDGKTYKTQSATMSAPIAGSGQLALTGKVTDSRGRSASKTITVNVLPYHPPQIFAFDVERCDEDGSLNPLGTHVKVRRAGGVSGLKVSGIEKNSLTYRVKARDRYFGGHVDWDTLIDVTKPTGGNNLLTNSLPESVDGWEKWAYTDIETSVIEDPTSPSGVAMKMEWLEDTFMYGYGGIYAEDTIPVDKGDVYTSSIWLRASRDLMVSLHMGGGTSEPCSVTTTWQKFTFTFAATSLSVSFHIVASEAYFPYPVTGDIVYWTQAKLEKGDTATPWGMDDGSGLALAGSDILPDFDVLKSFNIRLEFADIFNTTVAENVLPTGAVPMSLGREGVGFGKVWEQGAIDALGDIFLNDCPIPYFAESEEWEDD